MIFEYDEHADVLYVCKRGRTKFSVDLGAFVLDIDGKNHVIGIELLDASQLLRASPEMLRQIREAEFTVIRRGSYISATIRLGLPQRESLNLVVGSPLPQQKMPVLAIH